MSTPVTNALVDQYLVSLSTKSQYIKEAFIFDFPNQSGQTKSAKSINIVVNDYLLQDEFLQKEDKRSGAAIAFKKDGKILYEYLNSNKDKTIQCVYDKQSETAYFYGTDQPLLYEKIYLFIMSRIGEFQESDGILRIYGFAISFNQKTIIGLAPSGGGKSTLCSSLIKSEKVKLYSEDVVLIDEHLLLKTNKHRLSFVENLNNQDNTKLTRTFKRSGRPDKTLLHVDAIKDIWAIQPSLPTDIVSLRFTREKDSSFVPLGKFGLFKLLVRDLVIGYGLPQVVEFFLVNGLLSIIQKIPLVFKRLMLAIKLTFKCRGVIFYQSITQDNNYNSFLSFFTDA